MEVDLMTGGLPLRRMQDLARDAQAAGFSGLVVTESGRTAYLGCAAAALAADLDLLTGRGGLPAEPSASAAIGPRSSTGSSRDIAVSPRGSRRTSRAWPGHGIAALGPWGELARAVRAC